MLENSAISRPSSVVKKIDKDDNMILTSIFVGSVTAAVGYIYGSLLRASVDVFWKAFPAFLAARIGNFIVNPVFFVPAMVTLGGLVIGILSAKFPTTFAVSDFVSAFSKENAGILPSSKVNLLPVLLMSLITSAFGFSKGPEAPMVCAGGLIGASMSRLLYGKEDPEESNRHQETLAYAGAAGTLTAFMGIPIAGAIFALEMTRPNEGFARAGERALPPSVVASLAALFLVRGLLLPGASVAGHFMYGPVGNLSGRVMVATAVAAGVGGALLGTLFHKLVAGLKSIFWKNTKKPWKRHIIVKTFVGLLVGCLGVFYPQTLFWGEGSLQAMVDGQQTAFSATKHGLSQILSSHAIVNPHIPFQSWTSGVQICLAKLLAIALSAAGKFPGGIIFPLFYAAAPLAHAFAALTGPGVLPVAVMSLMAATQASATRTPLASSLILSLTASASSELSVMLPACLVASYLSVDLSRRLSSKAYFEYGE